MILVYLITCLIPSSLVFKHDPPWTNWSNDGYGDKPRGCLVIPTSTQPLDDHPCRQCGRTGTPRADHKVRPHCRGRRSRCILRGHCPAPSHPSCRATPGIAHGPLGYICPFSLATSCSVWKAPLHGHIKRTEQAATANHSLTIVISQTNLDRRPQKFATRHQHVAELVCVVVAVPQTPWLRNQHVSNDVFQVTIWCDVALEVRPHGDNDRSCRRGTGCKAQRQGPLDESVHSASPRRRGGALNLAMCDPTHEMLQRRVAPSP